MRFVPILAAFLWLAAPVNAEDRQTHEVESGEYLGLIAERYGVTVDQIKTWNHLESDRIRIGQPLVVSPEEPPAEAPHEWETTYTVVRGDHLARIGERVGLDRASLERANPGVATRRLRPGQVLRLVGPTRVVDHVVRRGETLARLADRYEVRHRELLEWNPVLRRRGLETGMTIRFYTSVRMSRSESVGAPNQGTLRDAEPLPAHRAYIIRNPAHSFGTHETVQWIVEAFDAALDADPEMPRLRIHDISTAEGGRLSGHRSHQSGRDVDISYFRRQCRDNEPCFMSRTGPEDLDAAHTWRVMRYWLERDLVTAIFVDHSLQQPLYEYASTHGATREQLAAWFQYPRSATVPVGTIRHFPAHADHFHVRFACPRGDDTCTEAVRRAPERPAPSAGREHAAPRSNDAEPTARTSEPAAPTTPTRVVPDEADEVVDEDESRDHDVPVSDAPGDSG